MKTTTTLFLLGTMGCAMNVNSQPQNKSVEKQGSSEKPNVLFILMDDMCDWANYLGGHNQVITPNLDRLANRGVGFSNAYAAVPFSNPSRASLLTGLPPTVTGIYQNTHEMQDSKAVDKCIILPEHFHNNGYYTLWSGKVFHNRPGEKRLTQMWDDMSHRDGGYGPWMKNMPRPEKGMDWRGFEAWTGPDTDFPDVVNSRYVIDFLNKKHEKPFFVSMGIYRPHAPYTAPKRFYDKYDPAHIQRPAILEGDLDDIPPYALEKFFPPVCSVREELPLWKKNGHWEKLIHAYLASVTFADEVVGNILDALEASPYADHTIVVLVGDNGFHQGQKERFGKMALWREACHVPFIISLPQRLQAKIDSPVSLLDIYPTLVSLCELPPVSGLEGNDLAPLLANPTMEWDKPCLSNYFQGNFVVHYKNWNYIRYVDGSAELYNIAEDENEFYNIVDKPENQELIRKLTPYIPTTWEKPLPNRKKHSL